MQKGITLRVNRTMLVFLSECTHGLFGSNCSKKCSINCKVPGRCHRKTGFCTGGCQVGWAGNMCEKGKSVENVIVFSFFMYVNLHMYEYCGNEDIAKTYARLYLQFLRHYC